MHTTSITLNMHNCFDNEHKKMYMQMFRNGLLQLISNSWISRLNMQIKASWKRP